MTGPSATGNPLFDIWMAAQLQILQAMSPGSGGATGLAPGEGVSDAVWRAAADWRSAQNLVLDWARTAAASVATEGLAAEGELARLLDPARFLYPGGAEADRAIRSLLDAAEVARFGGLEANVLMATRARLGLTEARAE